MPSGCPCLCSVWAHWICASAKEVMTLVNMTWWRSRHGRIAAAMTEGHRWGRQRLSFHTAICSWAHQHQILKHLPQSQAILVPFPTVPSASHFLLAKQLWLIPSSKQIGKSFVLFLRWDVWTTPDSDQGILLVTHGCAQEPIGGARDRTKLNVCKARALPLYWVSKKIPLTPLSKYFF